MGAGDDSDLDGATAAPIFEMLQRAVEGSGAAAVAACLDPGMRSLFNAAIAATNSDEGALWLPDRAQRRLVPIHHRGKDDEQTSAFLKEVSQPLDCGLISMVFAGGTGICENSIADNTDHSKIVDRTTGRETGAMIAVPVRSGGAVLAVATAVKIVNGDGLTTAPYRLDDLSKVESMASLLGELLELRLMKALVADV